MHDHELLLTPFSFVSFRVLSGNGVSHVQLRPAVCLMYAGLLMMKLFLLIMMVTAAAVNVAGGACNASQLQCYANHDALYNHTAMDTPEECCAACLADKRCASFTHWLSPSDGWVCFRFWNVNTPAKHSRNCTSGISGRPPAPPTPPPTPPTPAPTPLPNLLLFLPAGVRAESVAAYGHPLARTPHFDALAARGTRFNQAHALATESAPSRCALLSGRFMHSHAHRTTGHLLQSWESNVLGYLRSAGYYVAWFGQNDALSAEAFELSVDHWDGADAGADAVAAAAAFLRAPTREPFVAFVPATAASAPYIGESGGSGFALGQPGYYSFFNNGSATSITAAQVRAQAPLRPAHLVNKPRYHSRIPALRDLDDTKVLGSDFFERINAVYLEQVSATDAALGTLLDALDSSNRGDSTAVIVTSTHGDFAGDNHLVETWPGGLDDVLTRVPLIASIPGGAQGHVVQEPVQAFDVMATLLELGQVKPNATHFARSLVPQLRGAAGDPTRRVYAEGGFLYPTEIEPLHSGGSRVPGPRGNKSSLYYPRGVEEMEGCENVTLGQPNFSGCHGSPRAVMSRGSRFKLVYRVHGVSELYDLRADPRELHNRWNDTQDTELAQAKREALDDLRSLFLRTSDTTDWQVKTGRGAAKMPPGRPLVPTGGRRAPGDTRPNFVFYFPDTISAESVGGKVYGNPVVETPWFDALAARGTTFAQCHVLHTQCAPSRHAMLTGRYLHTTGHRTQDHGVEPWEPDLFKALHEAGYYINWFGKNDALAGNSWLGQNNSFAYVDFWEGSSMDDVAKFLQNNAREPFFTFIPTSGAHPAYHGSNQSTAPCFKYGEPGFFSFYNNCTASKYDWRDVRDKAPLRPKLPAEANHPAYRREDGIVAYRNLTTLDDEFFQRLNSVYLDMVNGVDALLGSNIIEPLNANTAAEGNVSQRTAIIVSSDHGDFSGNYHLVEKWPGGLDDLLTHVPLIVSIPGGAQDHVVQEPVQLFDIMPTVLELAGVRPNFTHFARSLVPQLRGAAGDPARKVYSEGGFLYPTEIEPMQGTDSLNPTQAYYPRAAEEAGNFTGGCARQYWDDPEWTGCNASSPRAVMVRGMDWKLVYRPDGQSELFDLKADPRTLTNLWDEAPFTAVQEELLQGLLDWYIVTTDVTPLAEDATALPPAPTPGQHRQQYWWEWRNPALHPELELAPLQGEEEENEENLRAAGF